MQIFLLLAIFVALLIGSRDAASSANTESKLGEVKHIMVSNSPGCGYPTVVRNGLHPFQYYCLAKVYLSQFNEKNAKICVAKLRKCQPTDESAKLADRLEDTLMPKYPVPDEALTRFIAAVDGRRKPDYAACDALVREFPKFEWPYFVLLSRHPLYTTSEGKEERRERTALMHKVLEINPHNVNAFVELAEIASRNQDTDKAAEYLETARSFYPDIIRHNKYFEAPSKEEIRKNEEQVRLRNIEHEKEYAARQARRLKDAQEKDAAFFKPANKQPASIQQSSQASLAPASSFVPAAALERGFVEKAYMFVDKSGKIAVRCGPNCFSSDTYSDGMLIVKPGSNGNRTPSDIQCWNKDGDTVFSIGQSDSDLNFSENLLSIKGENWRRKFVDTKGDEVIPSRFRETKPFQEGLAAVKLSGVIDGNEPWGFIDRSGAVVAEPIYNDVYSFSEGLAAVSLHGKIGFINKNGIFVIPPKFDMARPFSDGIANVAIFDEEKRKWDDQYIDLTGKVLFHDVFDIPGTKPLYEQETSGNQLNAHKERYSFLQWQARYDDDYDFYRNVVLTRSKEGKYGFRNRKGEFVIEPKFDLAHAFHNDMAVVRIGQKFGFININGKLAIPAEYEKVSHFSEELAAVSHDGVRWGYIDKTGTVVIPEKYLDAKAFSEGLAKVGFEY